MWQSFRKIGKEVPKKLSEDCQIVWYFYCFLEKTIAYKMKIRILQNNLSMPIFHTSWYLTWCKIVFKNDQFSGKIWKCAISYKKSAYKMKILIFWNNPAPSLFNFHRPLTTCQVSEKIMNRSWENCVANERTDEQDWIYRTLSDKSGVQKCNLT